MAASQAQREQAQHVPVRVYQTDNRVMVAAPMPGLEPENISVTIAGDRVTIRGALRGVRQDDVDLLSAEWTVGPYYREIVLGQPVDGALSNASYGNGVLVLALPKLQPGEGGGRTEYRLTALEPTRGERVGHSGQEIIPTTTAEHEEQIAATTRSAGGAPCGSHRPG